MICSIRTILLVLLASFVDVEVVAGTEGCKGNWTTHDSLTIQVNDFVRMNVYISMEFIISVNLLSSYHQRGLEDYTTVSSSETLPVEINVTWKKRITGALASLVNGHSLYLNLVLQIQSSTTIWDTRHTLLVAGAMENLSEIRSHLVISAELNDYDGKGTDICKTCALAAGKHSQLLSDD
ncbi:hypothetical protein EV368DRAFT_69986 [Lentinula lateritia]|nr:hypothetical protein EV368DRAFT_69986 [Lentinula lateritia]